MIFIPYVPIICANSVTPGLQFKRKSGAKLLIFTFFQTYNKAHTKPTQSPYEEKAVGNA